MDVQIKAYCFDVAQQDPFTMPVVNKKQLCARRDSSYDMFSVAKPELQGGQYDCSADQKLCGGDSPIQFLFCVPEKSACPITGIKYDEAGVLTSLTEPSKLPLIEVKLSQGGPPCAHAETDLNAQTGKDVLKHRLIVDEYYKSCPELKFGSKTFTTSTQFTKIDGFTSINELDLLEQNQGVTR